MYRKFVQFIEEHTLITKDDNLIAGISGGADSVCLLSLLCKYKKEIPFSLTVVHINHMIRKEAGEDALYVEKLCQEYELPCIVKEVPVECLAKQWSMSTEEAGRKVRYDAFNQALGGKEGKIVVAHNQNDCAETVLFHLFRGSSATGLSGIPVKNGNIIRPLLCFSRKDIENYLNENHIKYCIDKTNLTDDYTRNKIRNHILPYVEEEIAKGSIEHIYNAATLFREQEEFLNKQVLKEYEKYVLEDVHKGECVIEKEKFNTLDIFLKKKILLMAIGNMAGSKKDITKKHVESLLSLFDKEGTKYIDLPYQLCGKAAYKTVSISQKKEREKTVDNENFTYEILSEKMEGTIPEKTYTKWFDYDKIDGNLLVRTRQEGDFLMVQNGLHKKSLNRYFIDEKIPKDERDNQLLVADGSHILWVVGGRISDYYKVTKETKTILKIQYGGDK